MPFGGKTIVFGGDFRQILLVIPKGSRQDIVNATINASYLWLYCKVLRLTKNMRLQNSSSNSDSEKLTQFSEWIANIGDGESQGQTIGCEKHYYSIREFVEMFWRSDCNYCGNFDSACKSDSNVDLLADVHTPEFLNGIKCSGVPNHELRLKVGTPIMLLRNIDHSVGLCNGTMMVITKLGNHVLEAMVLSGSSADHKILIPRMSLTTSDLRLHFRLLGPKRSNDLPLLPQGYYQ
ncbi:PREDICTED: uncharacterized protein LOC109187011 [Ipomoea nil]|uniref:uncharacterized protein LOC109187011 n=1 Tax=Ipomoea nil TaxID=35883 RepID=UPI000901349E|nr:PREDICTED: uncharacterized protein LOC109187011 [Ipomoea nil]